MKACCYARTSTLDQAREEKVSIPEQIKWAREFATSREWEFTDEYIEPGVKGDVEFEQRDAASQLLRDAKPLGDPERKFDIVLVYHSSRLAREADLIARFHRVLAQDCKIQVYIRNVPIEPVEPENYYWGGNYMQQVMTSLAGVGDQQENVARSERVRTGFQGLAQRGKLVFAPYGYRKVPQIITLPDGKQEYDWYFEIDKPKALIVREIFERYTKGGSLRAIQMALNDRQIPSPGGKIGVEGWTATTIRNILSNPTYTGVIRWGRKLGSKYKQGRAESGKQRRVIVKDNNKLIINPNGSHPRIIDPEVFDKVQERLKIRGQIHGRAIASEGLLVGIVKCGICGRRCYYKTRRAKSHGRPYIRSDYICQTHLMYGKNACRRYVIAANKLDQIIISNIEDLVKKAKQKKKLFYSGKDDKKNLWQQKRKLLISEVKEQRDAAQRLLRVYTAGKITLEAFGEESTRISGLIANKEGEVKEFDKKLNNVEEMKKGEQHFAAVLADYKTGFDRVDMKGKKEKINNLIEVITVGKQGDIDIKYRL